MNCKIFIVLLITLGFSQTAFSQSESFQKMLSHFTKSAELYKKGLKESYSYFELSAKYLDSSKVCFSKIQASLSVKNKESLTTSFEKLQALLKTKNECSTDAKKKMAALLSVSILKLNVNDVGYEIYASNKNFQLKILKPELELSAVEDREDILQVKINLSNTSDQKIAHLLGTIAFYSIYDGKASLMSYVPRIDQVINLAPGQTESFVMNVEKRFFERDINYKSMTSDFITCLLVPHSITYADDTFLRYFYFPLEFSEKYYNLNSIVEGKGKVQADRLIVEQKEAEELNKASEEKAMAEEEKEKERQRRVDERLDSIAFIRRKESLETRGLPITITEFGKVLDESNEKVKGYVMIIKNNTGKDVLGLKGILEFPEKNFTQYPQHYKPGTSYPNYDYKINLDQKLSKGEEIKIVVSNEAFAKDYSALGLPMKFFIYQLSYQLKLSEVIFTDEKLSY